MVARSRPKRRKKTASPPRSPLPDVKKAVRELLSRGESIQSGDIARLTGFSRQAIHRHVRQLVDAGELAIEGAGRGARYRLASRLVRRLSLAGLEEDRVFAELVAPALERLARGQLSGDARAVFQYAFTELLNNAIDHSAGSAVEIAIETADERRLLVFEIVDDGVGIFDRVRSGLRLPDRLAALQELSKGKVTTMPERHTGEGIFFSSKLADRFEIDSGGLLWVVDNLIDDMAVGEAAPRQGTRVRFEARHAEPRSLTRVFEEYTHRFRFTRTRTLVKLFAIGTRFVSRSEARRLVLGLEKFDEVTLDFGGVELVGQGFADEVFRVWARAHPRTQLSTTRMSAPVEFMIERARHDG